MKDTQYPIVTVGGLIFNPSDEVLMIRTAKWSNLWGIPGGKVEWGETLTDALRRELFEETHQHVTEIQFVLVQDCVESPEFHKPAHFVLLNYTCRCAGTEAVRLNDEGQEFRWLGPREALKLALNHPTRVLIEAVLGNGGHHGSNPHR